MERPAHTDDAATRDTTTRGRVAAATTVQRGILGFVVLAALATAAVIAMAATPWIGTTFPGFFVLENGVVASIGQPSWPASRAPLYQHVVTAIDGIPVEDGATVYHRVAARPAGTAFTYDVETASAHRTVVLPSRALSATDYWTIFGGYFATGLLYLLLAIVGAALARDRQLARALVLVGSAGGAYALSAVGIYGPEAPLRLHALIEACFPATLVTLALVFPRPWPALTPPAVALAWTLALLLAGPYQLLLPHPGAYSALHATCELYLGAAGIAVVARLVIEVARPGATRPPLVVSALGGAVLGLGIPAIIFVVSGVTGGRLPVNTCTATAFLFPLAVGYGVVREHRAAERAVLGASSVAVAPDAAE